MKKKVRLVCINGVDVTITSLDFDYPNYNENINHSEFNVTFNVSINNKSFVLNFSNEKLSNKSQYFGESFTGNGEAYSKFLTEVESSTQLQDKKQYSDDTKNEANKIIGAIAQSIYSHVQSHSPDQDEE